MLIHQFRDACGKKNDTREKNYFFPQEIHRMARVKADMMIFKVSQDGMKKCIEIDTLKL